jgi:DDB1- and CUL4-associated factor 7
MFVSIISNLTRGINVEKINTVIYRIDPQSQFRVAVGSYMEQYTNTISIIRKSKTGPTLYKAGEFDHPYPCTKVLFTPDVSSNTEKDLLATTGDYLRIWSITDADDGDEMSVKVTKSCVLNSNKSTEYCAPLTSFDWNEADPSIIGTCSVDTTCTIWDIVAAKAKTQLIAHDRDVFDMAFARGKDVFASVGADGSVRMFDLRALEHSTIIYESPNYEALLRLEWNKKDPNYLATFAVERSKTVILDIRRPSIPLAELGGHIGPINSVAWAPHSPCHICTVADDKQALIWDLRGVPKRPVDDPILAYNADGEINNMHWSVAQPDWVSITYKDKLQILRV